MILLASLRRLALLCLSPFAWERSHYSGVWCYWENRITGERTAIQYRGGYSPKDWDWLKRRSDIKDKWEGKIP